MANSIVSTQVYKTKSKNTDKVFKAKPKSSCFRKKKVFKEHGINIDMELKNRKGKYENKSY